VEMFFDRETMSTPLDATLVKGSHGYPADSPERQGVLISSSSEILRGRESAKDTDVASLVLEEFGAPTDGIGSAKS
ncbi:MAG TPA: hypothetical protein VLA12_08855, partial [Planctomycetaceae bacterium]|nr:hypothetical protein [Planctomycetaceae bacterium]